MSDLFVPVGDWQRLSDRYVTARRLGALVANSVLGLAIVITLGLVLNWWFAAAAGVTAAAWTTWRVVRAGRWVRSYGYSERAEDLLITHGLWQRQLTAIPYGRMQSVKVESGPIDRAWGLATVTLVTASVQSHASIPGLSQPTAAQLRDRLIATGEAQALPI